MSFFRRRAREHMAGAAVILSMSLNSLYRNVHDRGMSWERGLDTAVSFALMLTLLGGVCLLFLYLIDPLRRQYEEDRLNS